MQHEMIAFFNGYHIRALRLEMGLGLVGLASILGVIPGTLSRWETGDATPAYASVPALLILLLSHEVVSLGSEKSFWWPKRKLRTSIKIRKEIADNAVEVRTRKGNVRTRRRRTPHVLFSKDAVQNARVLYEKLREAHPAFLRACGESERQPYFTAAPGFSQT